MKWFKKTQDLYDLLLLETLHYGEGGSQIMRVPGGWIFTHQDAAGRWSDTFVPYSQEFLNLNDENVKIMAEVSQGLDDQESPKEEDTETGKD